MSAGNDAKQKPFSAEMDMCPIFGPNPTQPMIFYRRDPTQLNPNLIVLLDTQYKYRLILI